MLGIYRKEYLVRLVLLTAMVWGFALPVVHLVCGMANEQESVLCDDHAVTEGPHASGTHAIDAGTEHAVHAGAEHAVHAGAEHVVHAGAEHVVHAGADHAVYAAEEFAIQDPTANIEARDVHIECCWVDANAVDRRAPLPSLTQVPDLAVSHSDATTTDPLPEVRTADLVVADGAPPPISFRLLFSVFLI